jgi:hypothetical protein
MNIYLPKVAANAEADVGALSRRILLTEDVAESSENRLATAIRYSNKTIRYLGTAMRLHRHSYQVPIFSYQELD